LKRKTAVIAKKGRGNDKKNAIAGTGVLAMALPQAFTDSLHCL
jgi:hypothetical protein